MVFGMKTQDLPLGQLEYPVFTNGPCRENRGTTMETTLTETNHGCSYANTRTVQCSLRKLFDKSDNIYNLTSNLKMKLKKLFF